MSRPKQAIVSRTYKSAPDECARALEVLLNKPVTKKATRPVPEPSGHDNFDGHSRRKGGPRDLIEHAVLGTEGDRTEEKRKDKNDVVHR